MSDMKSIRQLFFATAFILVATGIASARRIHAWSYQELLDKSDLVAIATPTATNDTKEHINLPGFVGQPVIGVETSFTVSAVLKGDKAPKDFVLHHYRADRLIVPNGPKFVAFAPAEKRTFILFLVRETDGRYASTGGQADPDGIHVLGGAGR
jgi:hypothetical protein